MARLNISQQEYNRLRATGMSREQILATHSSDAPKSGSWYERTLGSNSAAGKIASGVTNFVGAKGVADQYGASMARTGLKLSGNAEAAQYVDNPSFRNVAGSAIQTGANFIPGARGAILAKTAVGAGTGYAFDVGSNLQEGKKGVEAFTPGIGTAVGAILPSLGAIIGATFKGGSGNVAKKLEDLSLRLTPVERQNLQKQGKDIAGFLAERKVVGTPAQRYGKVTQLYDDMEKRVEDIIERSGGTFVGNGTVRKVPLKFSRDEIIAELNSIPDTFMDDPELAIEAQGVAKRLSNYLLTKYPKEIDAIQVNKLKRNYMNRAFAKNATDVVSDTRLAIGALFNKKLRDNIGGLEPLNQEYGHIIASKRALHKAMSRPQIGLVGKLTGAGAAGALGGALLGPAGVAAGTVVGPTVGKALMGTLPRSAVGAGFQSISDLATKIQSLPTDGLGNVSQKAILNLLQGLQIEPKQ